jgi:hypothetical protein
VRGHGVRHVAELCQIQPTGSNMRSRFRSVLRTSVAGRSAQWRTSSRLTVDRGLFGQAYRSGCTCLAAPGAVVGLGSSCRGWEMRSRARRAMKHIP